MENVDEKSDNYAVEVNTVEVNTGVISPVAPDAPIEELQCYMSTNNSYCKIVKVQRLKSRNGAVWEDSASLKITFSGSEKVQSVTIGKSFYQVRPYIAEPTQCFNCQRLGHTRSRTNL